MPSRLLLALLLAVTALSHGCSSHRDDPEAISRRSKEEQRHRDQVHAELVQESRDTRF